MKFKKFIAFVILVGSILIVSENNKAKEIENKKQKYMFLKEIKNETNFTLEDNKLLLPCDGILTSKYGNRESSNPIVSKNHKGVDIGASKGSDILAAHSGVVLKAETIGNYGKCVILQNDDYTTVYAHCSKIIVKEGCSVEKGEKIAEVGMTRKCYRVPSAF